MVRKFSSDLRKLGRNLNEIGSFALATGAAMTGPLALAFNSAGKYSREVSDELEKVKTVTASLQISIAQAMIPVVQSLTNILGRLYQAWQSLESAQQASIVQGVLLTGIFLTLTGTLIKFVAGIFKTVGTISMLWSGLNPLVRIIMLIVAALGLMIQNWDKVKKVAMPILNGLELGINMVALGFQKMIAWMVDGLIDLSVQWSGFLKVLARVPGPQQNAFLEASDALDHLAGKLRLTSVAVHQTVNDIEKNMEKIFVSGSGEIIKFAQDIKLKLEDLKKFIQEPGTFNFSGWKENLRDLERQTKTMHDVFIDTSTQAAQAMARSMGDFFFNPFSENVRSAKEMFADFGRSIARILADVAAKLIISMTLGRMFGAFNILGLKFHSGGIVPKAHDGAFVNASPSREFPILVRGGETIRTEAQEALLHQRKGQNITIQPVVVIQAWDTQDVMRNKDAITGIIQDAVSRNGPIRETFRRYA